MDVYYAVLFLVPSLLLSDEYACEPVHVQTNARTTVRTKAHPAT